MTLLPVFEWLGQSALGVFMQQSTYAFEIAEMVHLLALAGLGGSILIIDLRVLGLGLKSQPPARLLHELMPCLAGCLCASIATGILLLAAEPLKCYSNPAFRIKMLFLLAAILFSALIQRPLLQRRVTAAVSLLLWLGVGLAGRAIGVI
jgi:hypothetical protein